MNKSLEKIRRKWRARLREVLIDSHVDAIRAPTRAEKRDYEDCQLVMEISGADWKRHVYLVEIPNVIDAIAPQRSSQ